MIRQMNKARVPSELVKSRCPAAITNVRRRHQRVEHEHRRRSFSARAREEIRPRNIVPGKFGLDWAAPGNCRAISIRYRSDKIDIVRRSIIFTRRELLALDDVALHFLVPA